MRIRILTVNSKALDLNSLLISHSNKHNKFSLSGIKVHSLNQMQITSAIMVKPLLFQLSLKTQLNLQSLRILIRKLNLLITNLI